MKNCAIVINSCLCLYTIREYFIQETLLQSLKKNFILLSDVKELNFKYKLVSINSCPVGTIFDVTILIAKKNR